MTLGERIKNARQKKGLTQKELAIELTKLKNEVAHNTVSNWEKGISIPSADTLINLCEILDIEPNYLLGWGKAKEKYDEIVNINRAKEVDTLTKEQWEEIKRYAGYIKSKDTNNKQ